jgi:hypothetical protein
MNNPPSSVCSRSMVQRTRLLVGRSGDNQKVVSECVGDGESATNVRRRCCRNKMDSALPPRLEQHFMM